MLSFSLCGQSCCSCLFLLGVTRTAPTSPLAAARPPLFLLASHHTRSPHINAAACSRPQTVPTPPLALLPSFLFASRHNQPSPHTNPAACSRPHTSAAQPLPLALLSSFSPRPHNHKSSPHTNSATWFHRQNHSVGRKQAQPRPQPVTHAPHAHQLNPCLPRPHCLLTASHLPFSALARASTPFCAFRSCKPFSYPSSCRPQNLLTTFAHRHPFTHASHHDMSQIEAP